VLVQLAPAPPAQQLVLARVPLGSPGMLAPRAHLLGQVLVASLQAQAMLSGPHQRTHADCLEESAEASAVCAAPD